MAALQVLPLLLGHDSLAHQLALVSSTQRPVQPCLPGPREPSGPRNLQACCANSKPAKLQHEQRAPARLSPGTAGGPDSCTSAAAARSHWNRESPLAVHSAPSRASRNSHAYTSSAARDTESRGDVLEVLEGLSLLCSRRCIGFRAQLTMHNALGPLTVLCHGEFTIFLPQNGVELLHDHPDKQPAEHSILLLDSRMIGSSPGIRCTWMITQAGARLEAGRFAGARAAPHIVQVRNAVRSACSTPIATRVAHTEQRRHRQSARLAGATSPHQWR